MPAWLEWAAFLHMAASRIVITSLLLWLLSTPASFGQSIIFVADGAGGFLTTSRSLEQVLRETGAPACIETFVWTHGFGRLVKDQSDTSHLRASGAQLALRVQAYRANNPGATIYLVGHSAGSGVVLYATELLPADCVERIVLLAPSVSSSCDVKPALRASRQGMDVFYSHRDVFFLGLGVRLVGQADKNPGPSAGRRGFQACARTDEEQSLLAKLRQIPWESSMKAAGNRGGHIGPHQPAFLKAYVLPMLGCACANPPD